MCAGQVMIGDKNYHGRDFETTLAHDQIQLLRPAPKGEPERAGARFFKPLRLSSGKLATKPMDSTVSPMPVEKIVTSIPSSAPPVAVIRMPNGSAPTSGGLIARTVAVELPLPFRDKITLGQSATAVLILFCRDATSPALLRASRDSSTKGRPGRRRTKRGRSRSLPAGRGSCRH